jgi:hypothetical protein
LLLLKPQAPTTTRFHPNPQPIANPRTRPFAATSTMGHHIASNIITDITIDNEDNGTTTIPMIRLVGIIIVTVFILILIHACRLSIWTRKQARQTVKHAVQHLSEQTKQARQTVNGIAHSFEFKSLLVIPSDDCSLGPSVLKEPALNWQFVYPFLVALLTFLKNHLLLSSLSTVALSAHQLPHNFLC